MNANMQPIQDVTPGNAQPVDRRKVLELIRVSTMAQAGEDRAGIPAQKSACRTIAGANGLTVGWEPVEIVGVSGASVMYSPGMKRLQEIVKSGKCSGVIMKEVSRLMRPEDFGDYALLEVLKEHKTKIYTENGVFDLTNESGALMATIHAGMSGYERTLIRKRLQGAREAMRAQGKHASGPQCLPLGVTYDKKTFKWAYGPDISRVVRLFELFTGGVTSYRELARKAGVGYYSVPQLLRNPLYTGWKVWDKVSDASSKRVDSEGRYTSARKIARPCPLRRRVIETGAVSDAMFAQAQTILAVKGEARWRRNVSGPDPFLFRGLLRCGHCGGHLTTLRSKKDQGAHPREYYVCKNVHGDQKLNPTTYSWEWRTKNNSCPARRMRREKLEAQLEVLIQQKLADPGYLLQLMEAQRQALAKQDNRAAITRLQRDLKTCADRRARLTDLYLNDGTIAKEEYNRRRAELDEQEGQINIELSKIRPTIPQVTPQVMAQMLMPFMNWNLLHGEEKRALLRQTIPVFNVSADAAGYNRAEYRINGFFLSVLGELPAHTDSPKGQAKAPQSAASGPGRKRPGKAGRRINSGDVTGAGNLSQIPMDQITCPPPGGLSNSHPIYIAL